MQILELNTGVIKIQIEKAKDKVICLWDSQEAIIQAMEAPAQVKVVMEQEIGDLMVDMEVQVMVEAQVLEAMEATLAEPRCRCPAPLK